MEGSLPNLYKSLENLNDDYIEPNKKKDTYLKPMAAVSSSSLPLLALEDASTGKNSYSCKYCGITTDSYSRCGSCGRKMIANVVVSENRGLVKGVVTYMVMDDLEIKPLSTISSIALLNKFNVKDVGVLEEKVVNLGMTEALKLLKYSHESKNVLTDVFC